MDNETRFAAFFNGYLEALYFTETGFDEERYAPPDGELDPGFKADQRSECLAFWAQARLNIPEGADAQAGHDFWLTRNGLGEGFWSRPADTYGSAEARDKLAELAQQWGQVWEVIWQ